MFPFLFFCLTLSAQSPLYIPSEIRDAYTKGTRSPDGSPGKNYWQNRGDYDLKIKFDPSTRLLTGSAQITYYNNSPDTLRELVIRLYPDFYKKGGKRDIPIAWEDESDGVMLRKLSISGKIIDTTAKAGKVKTDFTNRTVQCDPIHPRSIAKLEVEWHYTLNKGSHSRTGQVDDGAFFIAYCFPRIAVYDDAHGWDNSIFMGNNEPYFDFGNFNAEITVPGDYVVWATGELQNAQEVFSPSVHEKYKRSLTTAAPIFVIDSIDLAKKQVTIAKPWSTYKFNAVNVPDFSFALSNHYLWEAVSVVVDPSTKRRTVVNTIYNNAHHDFREVNYFSRRTVEIMSNDMPGVPYPYPHITVFDGLDQMEYPMMANDNPIPDRAETIELTDHEIFHTFFPFYMGTDQTRYAWMDEGWATFGEWYITHLIDTTIIDEYGMDRVKKNTGTSIDLPLIIPSTETKLSYFINAYAKPGLVYLYLKDMLGEKEFRKALQHYMKQWNGKHPLPWDFFNCINTASGQNLDWFWKQWFYEWGELDLSIRSVVVDKKSERKENKVDGKYVHYTEERFVHKITVGLEGTKPAPIYLQATFSDGSKKEYHQSAMVWKDKKEYIFLITEEKEIVSVTMKNVYVPERNESDNTWKKK